MQCQTYPAGDIVLDPFLGSGTVCAEALRFGRLGTGIELNRTYATLAEKRIRSTQPTNNGTPLDW